MAPELDAAIRAAIAQKRLVRFTFQGHEREAEPHDYGIRNGSAQLLVYQTGGGSKSGKLPNWRWVTVENVTGFRLLEKTFPGRRAAPSDKHSVWDRLFVRVDESI